MYIFIFVSIRLSAAIFHSVIFSSVLLISEEQLPGHTWTQQDTPGQTGTQQDTPNYAWSNQDPPGGPNLPSLEVFCRRLDSQDDLERPTCLWASLTSVSTRFQAAVKSGYGVETS